MNLISVNLGREQNIHRKGRVERTGIFKLPPVESVKVTKLGLEGDVIVSKRHHGGPDQAVYISTRLINSSSGGDIICLEGTGP